MAQLLLSQGHWQQARQVYQEIYDQNPEKHAHIQEILAEIDREYTAKAPFAPDRTTIIQTQIGYLKKFLAQIKEES